MMPLTMTKAGETVTIRRISGKDEVRLHLAELVKQSRLALDKTMASRIMVD